MLAPCDFLFLEACSAMNIVHFTTDVPENFFQNKTFAEKLIELCKIVDEI